MKARLLFSLFLLTLFAFLMYPARGEEPAEQPADPFPSIHSLPLRWTECSMPGCVIVNMPDVVRLAQLYEQARERMADLERQLRELKVAKGCAKLEVTEPPRGFVPKKERDS